MGGYTRAVSEQRLGKRVSEKQTQNPLLRSRFLIIQQFGYNNRKAVFSMWSVSAAHNTPHTRGSNTTDVTKTPTSNDYSGRPTHNRTPAPARTTKRNKSVSNITYTYQRIPVRSCGMVHHKLCNPRNQRQLQLEEQNP
jgi:hypothetical protein